MPQKVHTIYKRVELINLPTELFESLAWQFFEPVSTRQESSQIRVSEWNVALKVCQHYSEQMAVWIAELLVISRLSYLLSPVTNFSYLLLVQVYPQDSPASASCCCTLTFGYLVFSFERR
mmetsp:Transcript_17111/g.26507  ORF Transcript_17111/g.26507 Transcript_17111/m.26507 type:complete len:120 (+) Transcript_17111:55-414(+)